MPKSYSEDLRERVVADTAKGLSIRAVAEKYSVSPSFVSKVNSVWLRDGTVAARRRGGTKRHRLSDHAEAVQAQLQQNKGMTLAELRDWALEVLNVRLHLSSVDRFVRSLGYSYKKNATGQRTRTG